MQTLLRWCCANISCRHYYSLCVFGLYWPDNPVLDLPTCGDRRLSWPWCVFSVGVAPTDAREFMQWLNTSSSSLSLSHLKYSVLAVGDSSYVHFCRSGRTLDDLWVQFYFTAFSFFITPLQYTVSPRKHASKLLSIFLLCVGQFSKFFDCHSSPKICHKSVIKDPTTS